MAQNENSEPEEEVKIIQLDLDQPSDKMIQVSTGATYKVIVKVPEFTISD